MLLSPNAYVIEHEKDTFEQLIEERKKLISELEELEQIVFDREHTSAEWSIMPQPSICYVNTLECLIGLSTLMSDRYSVDYMEADYDIDEDE